MGGRHFNPVGVVFLSLGQGEFNEPPPQVQGPTPPDGAWAHAVFRRAGPVSRQRQNPCTPAHGSPKAKSNASLASPRRQAGGVCLPRCTLKAPAVTVCIPSAPVTPQLALRAGQNPAYPHSPSPWMERGPGGEVFFWLLFFSVSTGGPGTPVPGSQRQRQKILRALRVFVVKNSPQISATTYQPTQISKQIFSKNFPNCSLNNAICASTIQGKWKGKDARRQWFRPPLLASRHLPQSTAARAG